MSALPVKKKTQTEIIIEKAKTGAKYLCVGSVGLLSAPLAIMLVKKYKAPTLRNAKKLALWAKENPRNALIATAVTSGVVAFGMPYVAEGSAFVRDWSLAEGKSWFAWNKADKDAYVEKLNEQIEFASGLEKEIYQQYIRVSKIAKLKKTGIKLQRSNAIFEQIGSLKDSRKDIVSTVEKQDGDFSGSLKNFAELSDCAKNSFGQRVKNLYRQPLWMEDFASLSPANALVLYLGNDIVGDVREIFGSVSTQTQPAGDEHSILKMINNLLEKYENPSFAVSSDDFDSTQRLVDLFESLMDGVDSFKKSRKKRINALNLVNFKEIKNLEQEDLR